MGERESKFDIWMERFREGSHTKPQYARNISKTVLQ